MKILKAEKCDLQEILDLQYLAYQSEAKLLNNPNTPPLKQTIEEVAKEYEKGIILKAISDENKIVGSVRAYCEDDIVYVGKLMVNPDYQGRGIGTKLLDRIEEEYDNKIFELFTSSKSAKNIKLYERSGYKIFCEKQVSDVLKFIYLRK